MTKEQYKKELAELDAKITVLNIRKNEIRATFLESNSEFNIGDKVVAIYPATNLFSMVQPEKRVEAFIGQIHDKYWNGNVRYEFKKVKKDGSMSNQTIFVSSNYERLELIEKAKASTP